MKKLPPYIKVSNLYSKKTYYYQLFNSDNEYIHRYTLHQDKHLERHQNYDGYDPYKRKFDYFQAINWTKTFNVKLLNELNDDNDYMTASAIELF